jgi:hypothetical protein
MCRRSECRPCVRVSGSNERGRGMPGHDEAAPDASWRGHGARTLEAAQAVPASASARPRVGAAAPQMVRSNGRREAVWRAWLQGRSWRGARSCHRMYMCHSLLNCADDRVYSAACCRVRDAIACDCQWCLCGCSGSMVRCLVSPSKVQCFGKRSESRHAVDDAVAAEPSVGR